MYCACKKVSNNASQKLSLLAAILFSVARELGEGRPCESSEKQ